MKRFKRIYIEITNVCNLNCKFCPATKRSLEYMELNLFRKLIDEIKDYTDYVYLHVKGEPLLHPDLEEILNICYQYGLQVNITTNGTLLNDRAEILYNSKSLRQLNISLHSLEDNDLVYLTEYMNHTIKFINNIKDIAKIIISLRLWNWREVPDNDNTIASLRNNKVIISILESAFGVNILNEPKIGRNNGILLSDGIYLNQEYLFDWPDFSMPLVGTTGHCYGLKQQIAILSDLTVVPCCLDAEGIIHLGNLKNQTLDDILSSPKVLNILSSFAKGKISEPLCQHCGYRKRF